jgi:activator of HSP90 ATPase
MEKLSLNVVLPVDAKTLFRDWLDSSAHAAFTGSTAEIDPIVGGAFTAWDGYILGTTLELDPPHRILQHWRTTEFPPECPDSLLELLFTPVDGGTRLTLNHTEIPDGQGAMYAEGWQDYYFVPMQEFYIDQAGNPA